MRRSYEYAYLSKIKVGDKVTTDFTSGEETVVHTVIKIEETETTGSGYRVWTSVEKCSTCGKPHGKPLNGYDAAWVKPIKEGTA